MLTINKIKVSLIMQKKNKENVMDIITKTKNLITKSNGLIEASYTLSVLEKKVVLMAIRANKKGNSHIRLSLKEIQNSIGIKSKDFKNKFDNIMSNILKKLIKMEIEDTLISLPWFASIRIDDSHVIFEFSDMIKMFLYELKKGFTIYHISMILKLKKFSSIRLYELFKKYEKMGSFNYKLARLKKITGHENQYKEYKFYKKKVLLPSIKEINEFTDINVKVEEIKEGYNVVSFKFKIYGKRGITHEK
jgi:plasmid replication initiation protein